MKRELIINKAAELLFDQQRNFSFRTIASELNISLGTINYHFKSKDKLIALAVQSVIEQSFALEEKPHLEELLLDIVSRILMLMNSIEASYQLLLLIQIQNNLLEQDMIEYIAKHYQDEISKKELMKIALSLQMCIINPNITLNEFKLDIRKENEAKQIIQLLL